MDSSKVEYINTAQAYVTNYVRNSKAIAVLWGIFTICFAIISVVVFVQPQWVGDTIDSKGTGYFGLWKHCIINNDADEIYCKGRIDEFSSIISPAFRAATVFTGLAVFITFFTVLAMLLFFCLHSSTVFHICGWTQLFTAACLLIGVLCFPAGWDAPEVKAVCGDDADDFNLGSCSIRWPFILAAVAVADAIVLATLAFVLATRYIHIQPSEHAPTVYSHGPVYKGVKCPHSVDPQYIINRTFHSFRFLGDVNSGFIMDSQSLASSANHLRKTSIAGSQPVLLMPHPGHISMGEHDAFSEYSHHTGRSKYSSGHNMNG
jgi:hypothetical protein